MSSGSPAPTAPRFEGPLPTLRSVAKMIDHSLLRPELTAADVRAGLDVAIQYDTASVCVRPRDVATAADVLTGTDVAVGTVVAFPHGAATTRGKIAETEELVGLGAQEIDMVADISRLRVADVEFVQGEVSAVVAAAGGRLVKVILENCYLTDEQIVAGCRAVEAGGAAFVKTSTGFAPGGATAADVSLMRQSVSPAVKVKAAGGVRTLDALLALHELGADRFGATATAAILDDLAARLR